MALLSPILERARGADLGTLAQRQPFGPLDIERFERRRAGPVAGVGHGHLWFTGQLHGQSVAWAWAWAWGYGGQYALLPPALGLTVATAATSPPPQALRAQTDAVMALVGGVVQAALPA